MYTPLKNDHVRYLMTHQHVKYCFPLKTDQLYANHMSTLKTDPNNLTQYTYY